MVTTTALLTTTGVSTIPRQSSDPTSRFRGAVLRAGQVLSTPASLRGVPEDYDDWVDRGNSEWKWENVLPTFCRIERDLDFGHETFHGDAGPITVRRYPYDELTELHQAFLATADELGYPECPDQNDPDDWGAWASTHEQTRAASSVNCVCLSGSHQAASQPRNSRELPHQQTNN